MRYEMLKNKSKIIPNKKRYEAQIPKKPPLVTRPLGNKPYKVALTKTFAEWQEVFRFVKKPARLLGSHGIEIVAWKEVPAVTFAFDNNMTYEWEFDTLADAIMFKLQYE